MVQQIAPIEARQIEEAAQVLGRAFFDDPLQMYFLPGADERRLLSPPVFKAFLTYGHAFGHVLTPADSAGAAVWMRPGESQMSEEGMKKAGFFDLPAVIGNVAFERFTNFFAYIEPFHHRNAPAPHWYLAVIGVDPSRQGTGVGGAMIRSVLVEADKAALQCYLETTNPRNVPLYKHLGFSVLEEEVEPVSGVRFWTFLREPAR